MARNQAAPLFSSSMAALLAALADHHRGFDAVVIGSNERAFSGNQYSLVAPLLAMNGVELWMPEFGGRVDPGFDNVEDLMAMLGILARREVVRSKHRVINAMAAQVSKQGRYEGGRVPYGLRLVDGRPHPTGAGPGVASACSTSLSTRPPGRSWNGCSRCGRRD